MINFERNRYSVLASFANRPVSLRVYPDRLVVAAEGQVLCEHPRFIDRSHKQLPRTIYDWRHYLALAIVLGPPLAVCQQTAAGQRMADILALVLHHDEQDVLAAVEMALIEGVATKTHVLNLLHRLVDGKVTGGPDIHCPARTQDAHVYMHERGHATSLDPAP